MNYSHSSHDSHSIPTTNPSFPTVPTPLGGGTWETGRDETETRLTYCRCQDTHKNRRRAARCALGFTGTVRGSAHGRHLVIGCHGAVLLHAAHDAQALLDLINHEGCGPRCFAEHAGYLIDIPTRQDTRQENH